MNPHSDHNSIGVFLAGIHILYPQNIRDPAGSKTDFSSRRFCGSYPLEFKQKNIQSFFTSSNYVWVAGAGKQIAVAVKEHERTGLMYFMGIKHGCLKL